MAAASSALAAPPPAAGECSACHTERARNQGATAHARALAVFTGEHFDGRKLRGPGGIGYEYTGSKVTMQGAGGGAAAPVRAEIRWAFGAGSQAVTPVIERNDGTFVEHRVSWYREGNRLGLTPGHDAQAPLDLDDALGVAQSEPNAARCFGCHRTGGSEPGVHCQACHASGAAEHRAKPGRGNIARDRSVALCAQCHRSPDQVFASATPEIEDPRSIRFAPVGLLASKCYQKGAGAAQITCVSCHDPHGEQERRPTAVKVCTGCHPASKKAAVRKKCPRTGDCLSCHMKASSPMPGLRFTDHRIRIYVD